MTTPFDDPQAELAWMFLQSLCDGGDLDEGFALLGDDFTYWSIDTGATLDKAALRARAEHRKQVVEINLDLLGCINEGETVVIEARADGVTADGIGYDSPVVFIVETHDGLIVALREYGDPRLSARVFHTG